MIETDGSTTRTVEVGPGSRLEIKGPIAEGERVWVLVDEIKEEDR